MGLHFEVMDNIKKSGLKKPTPIQKTVIPSISNGFDIVVEIDLTSIISFAIPLLDKILQEKWSTTGLN